MNVDVDSVNIVASNADNPDYLASASEFFTRFKGYVNGVEVPLTGSIRGNGWAKNIPSTRMLLGDSSRGIKLDEFSLYDGVQSALAPQIYNGGSPTDLLDLTPTPDQ